MISPREMVIDNFAGGGGASEGIEQALGRPVDIAVNHDPIALAMHEANHPRTLHLCESVWDVDPREVCAGRPVGLAWFSPTCTHFSRAKGAALKDNRIRGLAWVVIKWARTVKPRIIMLENVTEFLTWGPVDDEGKPCPKRAGITFKVWVGRLKALGYAVKWRSLCAADYGAPTSRTRLFMVARCDGEPIVWPTPTHGPGRAHPHRTAAEIIDWSLPCPSIFGRQKPLAEATLRRIATGVRRYVIESKPYIVGNVAASMVQIGYGEREGQAPRALDIRKPLGTVVAGGVKHALVAAFLTKHYGGVVGHEVTRPLGTITTQDHHAVTTATLAREGSERVREFLELYAPSARRERTLLDLLTDDDGLVRANGETYSIVDIGTRMLRPHELFAAQGFPPTYEIAPTYQGKRIGPTRQTKLCGNSVAPCMSRALVEANTQRAQEVAA